jgi:hypothetical protein
LVQRENSPEWLLQVLRHPEPPTNPASTSPSNALRRMSHPQAQSSRVAEHRRRRPPNLREFCAFGENSQRATVEKNDPPAQADGSCPHHHVNRINRLSCRSCSRWLRPCRECTRPPFRVARP